jgi:hypothetical protein
MRKTHSAVWMFFVCAGLLSVNDACAQSLAEARADLRATYAFDPSAMTFNEQAQRADTLDLLWKRHARSPKVYAEALRVELRATGNTEMLYCDGGMLLLSQSEAAADLSLGLAALQKCSLVEIQQTPYFYTLHMLATRGVDTFDLQARMLFRPKYSVFIVPHFLTLEQATAFFYPFMVQEETVYVPRLITRFRLERDPVAQLSLLSALWCAATPEAELVLREFAATSEASPNKQTVQKMLETIDTVRDWKVENETLARLRASLQVEESTPAETLRAKRRARMRAISDEALHDLKIYAALIYRNFPQPPVRENKDES